MLEFRWAFSILMFKWLDIAQAIDLCPYIKNLLSTCLSYQYPNVQSVKVFYLWVFLRDRIIFCILYISCVIRILLILWGININKIKYDLVVGACTRSCCTLHVWSGVEWYSDCKCLIGLWIWARWTIVFSKAVLGLIAVNDKWVVMQLGLAWWRTRGCTLKL